MAAHSLFALIVAYSYAQFGARIVSNAGPIAFILKGLGDNLVTGALSILMWLTFVVSITVVTMGNLSLPQIIKAQDNALAIAARPFLGDFGFILISLGALFSISSALNATIYGGTNIAYSLAKDGELPETFERKVWFGTSEGLYFTAGLGLLFALVFDLGEIASITSSVFTIIYIFVIISHIRVAKELKTNKILLYFNLTILLAVFAALLAYQWETRKPAFFGTLFTLSLAMIVEYVYRKITRREIKPKNTESHRQ